MRALKQQLSRYLEQVQGGAEITVTDRGRPVARIVPVTDGGALQRGIDEGWIRPAVRERAIGGSARHRSGRRTSDVLDDDRS